MADRTLTINHADGGSETYTINRDKFAGVRSMLVDGATVSVDHTEQPDVRTLLMDGETITIDTTREGVRTLTVDGVTITIDRTDESKIKSFIEQFTAPAAAYSLRDLASNAGDTRVVRVRRSSDNQEADFTAAEVSNIATWVGAGNDGFVETWYDQSGNGNDATQGTISSQPKIVDAGALVTGGIDFDGVNDFFNAVGLDSAFRNVSNAFLFSVSSHDSAASGTECLIYGQAGANTGIARVYFGSVGTNDVAAGRRLDTDSFVQSKTAKTSGAKIRSANFNWSGGNVQLFQNGTGATATALSSGAGSTSDTVNSPFRIGRVGNVSSYWNGTVNEIIIYLSDQSANRTAIETNINDHYNIY
jgi:hypothetical protein